MYLEACKTTKTNFSVSLVAYGASWVFGEIALTTSHTELSVANSANYALWKICDMRLEARKAFCAYLRTTDLACATSREVRNVCLETTEATHPDFSVAALANTTTIEEPVRVASKTAHTDLLVPSATNCTTRV